MIQKITHRRPFNFKGIDTLSIVGKPLHAINTPIPFAEDDVEVTQLNQAGFKQEFNTSVNPDTVHLFRDRNQKEEFLFYIKEQTILSGMCRRLPPPPSLLTRLKKRWFKKEPKVTPEQPTSINITKADACKLLETFRVDLNDPEVQRYLTDDGINSFDLEELLSRGPLSLVFDWRDVLQDGIDDACQQLALFDISLTGSWNSDGTQGTITVEGQTEQVKYVPKDDDDFDTVIATINRLVANRLMAGRCEYRKFNSCIGSDTWQYALLSSQQWQELAESSGNIVDVLFTISQDA